MLVFAQLSGLSSWRLAHTAKIATTASSVVPQIEHLHEDAPAATDRRSLRSRHGRPGAWARVANAGGTPTRRVHLLTSGSPAALVG